MAKTFIDGKDILNLPEHSHPSDITQINFLLAECDALNKTIENPALPPRVILAEIADNFRQQGGQLMPKTSSAFIRSLQRVRVAHGEHPVTHRPSLKLWNFFQRSTSLPLGVSVFFATQVTLWRMVIQHL